MKAARGQKRRIAASCDGPQPLQFEHKLDPTKRDSAKFGLAKTMSFRHPKDWTKPKLWKEPVLLDDWKRVKLLRQSDAVAAFPQFTLKQRPRIYNRVLTFGKLADWIF